MTEKTRNRNKIIGWLLVFCFVILLSGCAEQGKPVSEQPETLAGQVKAEKNLLAMDTIITLSVYGETEEAAQAALASAETTIHELEQTFSTVMADSEVAAINRAGGQPVAVSEDVISVLQTALTVNQETDGAFAMTIYPLVQSWGFMTGDYRVPEQAEIDQLLQKVDDREVQLQDEQVQIGAGQEIDLGGVAKGYIAQKIIDQWRQQGITSAMLSLGGNVQLLGGKPDGTPWQMAVADPLDASRVFAVLQLEDVAAVTSGGYQRYFEKDGKTYHHILDPENGYPAENGLISVTVIMEDGAKADALSTALFVLGPEQAIAYWRAHPDIDLILVTEDQQVYLTPGLRDGFVAADETGGYTYEWLSETKETES